MIVKRAFEGALNGPEYDLRLSHILPSLTWTVQLHNYTSTTYATTFKSLS